MELYLVTDEAACMGRDFFWVVEEAVKGGVTLVQLREKALSTSAFIDKAKRLKELLAPYKVPLIINDSIEVALACDADGIHVGQSDMPFYELENVLPAGRIIGISAETKENVQEAEAWNISYLALSPLFATPSKTDTGNPWGMDGISWAKQNSRHPLMVIGGLNAINTKEAIQNGADGIAVISALCSSPSPYEAAKELRAIIAASKSEIHLPPQTGFPNK
ncbi:thiamine phosphate synthase [Dyadobacter sediminis]|uniref:Thiamine-phosphate synthase n=1 Tax=Dyadobacter sediminis TaxID=1493691 RepID=A0A5R9KAD2_9BACT|nr:thiamine phosphate synthase [Dyadobacter sediminis]TLU91684.1 thiamine phosphate synthase [Dyadobacter sediminis]GGC01234.1 thiamine-phosphate synthase [Dyadobacter sediminis]